MDDAALEEGGRGSQRTASAEVFLSTRIYLATARGRRSAGVRV